MIGKKELKEYIIKIKQYLDDNGVEKEFSIVSSLNHQKSDSLSWINREDYNLDKLKCNVLIVSENFKPKSNKILMFKVRNPRYTFAKIVKDLIIKEEKNEYISSKASISVNAHIGKNVIIKDNVIIGENCVIGNNVIIFPNVTIYDNTEIGNNVIVHSGSVIGATGFGYIKNEKQEYELFPHIGKVIIEDNVEIGANSCIDRAGIDATIIRKGTKLDNFVHVGHNVEIGKNSILTSGVFIGGSTIIGNNAWIGMNAIIKDRVIIGNNVKINIGAVIIRNVKDNRTVAGFYAMDNESWLRKVYDERRKYLFNGCG